MTTDVTKTEEKTGVVQPIKTSEIDWTALETKWREQREAAAAARKLERAVLLEALRGKGITVLEARYDGYADSGNVGALAVNPEDAEIGDIASRLADFIWGTAYGLHPGFEINDGGEGSFSWDMKSDRIDIDHADFYTERNEYVSIKGTPSILV